jgi:membrane protein DedA with SNARE-associated domain
VSPTTGSASLAYLAVFVAAAVEGEVVFVSASILVSLGQLDALGVFLAAALGASMGDQFFFYALRSRLRSWLSRFPRLARRGGEVAAFVEQHATAMILACRFLPGLRIAIPVACAYAGVSAVRFTLLNLIGSLAWAGTLLLVVTRLGPASLGRLGINAWWTPIVPAVLIIILFQWVLRKSRSLVNDYTPSQTEHERLSTDQR